ncbi:hypothetical protein MIR68_000351 [Amoeboaphelidium protococcarum]|nr:hypothetical protein MIR68_000351 [Amoeboaphelidium protococcarum]
MISELAQSLVTPRSGDLSPVVPQRMQGDSPIDGQLSGNNTAYMGILDKVSTLYEYRSKNGDDLSTQLQQVRHSQDRQYQVVDVQVQQLSQHSLVSRNASEVSPRPVEAFEFPQSVGDMQSTYNDYYHHHPFQQSVDNINQSHQQQSRIRFILCRHGETEANRERVLQGSGINQPLNNLGALQAASLAKVLNRYIYSAGTLNGKMYLYSSNMLRAEQTADAIQNEFNDDDDGGGNQNGNTIVLEKPTVEAIREISWGDWDGKRADADLMAELLYEWQSGNFDASAPNGESPLQVAHRVKQWIYQVIKSVMAKQENKSEPASNISLQDSRQQRHMVDATVIVVAHGRLLRIILAQLLQNNLHNMSSFHHHNCCINILDAFCTQSQNTASADSSDDDGILNVNWIPLVLDGTAEVLEMMRREEAIYRQS